MLEIHTISCRGWDAFVIENISRWGHNFYKHTFIICSVLHVPVSNVQHFMTIFFRKSVKNDKNVWNKETLARSLLMTCPLFFIWEIVRGDFRFLIYRDLYWNMISWIHSKDVWTHCTISCRLQYNNPVYFFNLTRKRGVF